ncbi:hypothetical protein LINPERHAP1_LOCUS7811 [Linum perenne]
MWLVLLFGLVLLTNNAVSKQVDIISNSVPIPQSGPSSTGNVPLPNPHTNPSQFSSRVPIITGAQQVCGNQGNPPAYDDKLCEFLCRDLRCKRAYCADRVCYCVLKSQDTASTILTPHFAFPCITI